MHSHDKMVSYTIPYLVSSPAEVVVAVAVSCVSVCSVSETADHQEDLLEGVVEELEVGDLLVGPEEENNKTDVNLATRRLLSIR